MPYHKAQLFPAFTDQYMFAFAKTKTEFLGTEPLHQSSKIKVPFCVKES